MWTGSATDRSWLCPDVRYIETISFNQTFLTEEFMSQFEDMNAGTLSRYIKWARNGTPRQPWKAPVGPNADRADHNVDKATQDYQKAQIEESIRYCKSIGLGIKT